MSQAGGRHGGQFPHHGPVIGILCANKNAQPPPAATHNAAPTVLHKAKGRKPIFDTPAI
jgi:hypothetical protein